MNVCDNSSRGKTAPSLQWLIKFAERVPADYSTGDVVSNIIVPETRDSRCRYIDLVPTTQCGRPSFFISHRWGSPFSHLVTALKKEFRDKEGNNADNPKVFVWLDIFAVNQHQGTATLEDLSKLQDVIVQSEKTLLVMDTHGQILSRVWCLYEIFKSVSLRGVEHLHVLAHGVDTENLKKILLRMDVRGAQATHEADRQKILDDIDDKIGLAPLNHLLQSAVAKSLIASIEANPLLIDKKHIINALRLLFL